MLETLLSVIISTNLYSRRPKGTAALSSYRPDTLEPGTTVPLPTAPHSQANPAPSAQTEVTPFSSTNQATVVTLTELGPLPELLDLSTPGQPPDRDPVNTDLFSDAGRAKIKAMHERLHTERMAREARERIPLYNFDLEAQLQERYQRERDWNLQCRDIALRALQDQTVAIAETYQKMGHPVPSPASGATMCLTYRGDSCYLPAQRDPAVSSSHQSGRFHLDVPTRKDAPTQSAGQVLSPPTGSNVPGQG